MSTTERAAYRILATNGFYGPDDHLYKEDDEIYFDGTPNEEMEPLNETARQRLETYLTYLDEEARKVSIKLGTPFMGRPKTIDGAYVMATELMRRDMSIMGAKKEVTEIEKIEKDETPQTGKRGRGRPKGSLNRG